MMVLAGGLIFVSKTVRLQTSASTVYSQRIYGKVYNRSNLPLSGVKITDSRTGKTAISASDGSYNLAYLDTGQTTIKFEKDGTVFNPGFKDIASTFWAYKEIGAAKNAGVIGGYSDNTFRPSDKVTRAQMAVFIARAVANANGLSAVPGPSPYENNYFKDVVPGYWAYKEIQYLARLKLISGYPDGTYKPEELVTRAQMAVYLARAIKIDPYNKISPSFKDVSKSYWAYKEIEALYLRGVVSGFPDGTYKPETPITRDQAAVFIVRAFPNIPLTQGGYIAKFQVIYIAASTSRQMNIYLAKGGEVGAISGRATNTSGTGISGARVVITRRPTIKEDYISKTDSSGNYSITNIPSGTYKYYVLKPGSNLNYALTNNITITTRTVKTLNLPNLQ